MRNVRLVSIAIAITLFFSFGAIGQQETLLVDLSIEPERSERTIGLYDAASSNNFRRFAQLYTETPRPEYAELHRLWTWSMEDPIGAFYGTEEYERLSSLYPGYRRYIDQYRIVDSRGNAFYPSAETRRFLLGEAVLGTTPVRREPVIRVAEAKAAPVATPSPRAATLPLAPRSGERVVLSAAKDRVRGDAPAPSVVPAPVIIPAPTPTPVPVVKPAAAEPELVRGIVRRNEANRGALSRSIFLMIAGLLGIGMITLMLQAPADEQDRNLTSHAP